MNDEPTFTPTFTSNVLVDMAQHLRPQDRAPFLTGASAALRLASEKGLSLSQMERTASVLYVQAAAEKERSAPDAMTSRHHPGRRRGPSL